MAISNAERVGKALELLNQGLFPFMKRELKAYYGDAWFAQASANLRLIVNACHTPHRTFADR